MGKIVEMSLEHLSSNTHKSNKASGETYGQGENFEANPTNNIMMGIEKQGTNKEATGTKDKEE